MKNHQKIALQTKSEHMNEWKIVRWINKIVEMSRQKRTNGNFSPCFEMTHHRESTLMRMTKRVIRNRSTLLTTSNTIHRQRSRLKVAYLLHALKSLFLSSRVQLQNNYKFSTATFNIYKRQSLHRQISDFESFSRFERSDTAHLDWL